MAQREFKTFFSDDLPKLVPKTKSVPRELPTLERTTLQSTEDTRNKMKVEGSHRTLFYRQPSRQHVASYSKVSVDLEPLGKRVSFENRIGTTKSSVVIKFPIKQGEKCLAKGTQTDFRESETQTSPWKHEIKMSSKLATELSSLNWYTLDKNYPPTLEELYLIENIRKRLAWENVIDRLKGKENNKKRKTLVLELEKKELALREKRKDEENQKRIEKSREEMEKAREVFENELWRRLESSYETKRKENDRQVERWSHQWKRKMRKLKSGKEKPRDKTDIIALYKDKTSELYAPKQRDGENPRYGHEIINIQCRYLKRFYGLEILERKLARVFQPSLFQSIRNQSKLEKSAFCPRKFREKALEKPDMHDFDGSSLRIPVPPPTPPEVFPQIAAPDDSDDAFCLASLFLQKTIKGRSIQTQKFLQYFKMASY